MKFRFSGKRTVLRGTIAYVINKAEKTSKDNPLDIEIANFQIYLIIFLSNLRNITERLCLLAFLKNEFIAHFLFSPESLPWNDQVFLLSVLNTVCHSTRYLECKIPNIISFFSLHPLELTPL